MTKEKADKAYKKYMNTEVKKLFSDIDNIINNLKPSLYAGEIVFGLLNYACFVISNTECKNEKAVNEAFDIAKDMLEYNIEISRAIIKKQKKEVTHD